MESIWPQALIAPHSPTLLQQERRGDRSSVIRALRAIGLELKGDGLDLVIAISTHWRRDEYCIDPAPSHRTVYDYSGFPYTIDYDVMGHPEMAEEIIRTGQEDLVFPEGAHCGADHAVAIPMHFLFPERNVPVVPVSTGGNRNEALRRGRSLRRAVDRSGYRVLLLASGSLSHDLEALSMWQSDPMHRFFDRTLMDLLEKGRGMDLEILDGTLIEAGKPEGDLCDLFMVLGFMGVASRAKVHAYESIPGVGLGVMGFQGEGVKV